MDGAHESADLPFPDCPALDRLEAAPAVLEEEVTLYALSDVRPKATAANELDGHPCHPVLGSEGCRALASRKALADSAHTRFVQLRCRRALTVARRAALPLCHLRHVVLVSAKSQVCRVATGWIVAGVQNVQSVRDRTVRVRKGEPVSVHLVANLAKAAIPAAMLGACPWPARIGPGRLVHPRPEALRAGEAAVPTAGMTALAPRRAQRRRVAVPVEVLLSSRQRALAVRAALLDSDKHARSIP